MRTPIRDFHRAAVPLLGLAAASLALAPLARAQAPQTDPRWGAWLGCWAPASAPTGETAGTKQLSRPSSAAGALLVCIVPAAGSTGVDVATVADTQVVSRDRLEATGERRALDRDGCSGWESAQWSADGARVYLRSELACQGNLRRRSSGVMALSAEGEWLDVRSVSAGTRSNVRVLRYHASPLPESLPPDVAAALRSAPRGAAGPEPGDLTLADVADASRALDADVVSAWLAETGQDFGMDAKRLQEARRDGIPGNVIDVMVALSYPDVFALNPRSRQAEFRRPAEGEVGTGYGYARPGWGYGRGGWGGWDYSPWGWDSWWPYGWSPYSPYYYPYGAYGWSPWYGGYGGWYYGGGGVVIVPNGGGYAVEHGRVVKGQGYVPAGGETGRSAHARGESGSPRFAGTRASGSSGDRRSAGSSGSGGQPASSPAPRSQPSSSGSSGSSSGRTAHPRNPPR